MKKILILILITTLILILVWFGFVFYNNSQNENNGNVKEDLEFFPIGTIKDIFSNQDNTPDSENQSDLINTNTPTNTNNISALNLITQKEIAGFTVGNINDEEVVIYIDQGTGNFYSYNLRNKENKQLTNTTISAIKKSWINIYDDVIYSLLGSVSGDNPQVTSTSFNTKLASSSVSQLGSEQLVPDFISASFSPNKTHEFILQDFNGGSVGIVKNLITGESEQIFTSPFKNWSTDWQNESIILLKTKGSFNTPGLVVTLNSNTGNTKTVLENIYGLTTKMSPDGQNILFTEKRGNFLETKILNLATKEKIDLPFTTLADKCIWLNNSIDLYCGINKTIPSGELPDIWYQGKLSFNDSIWKINFQTLDIEFIHQPNNQESLIDITNPTLSADESTLFFINKNDSKLWSFDLNSINKEIDFTETGEGSPSTTLE